MANAIYPSLKDRTVVVTGGATGIGEAIVRAFAGQGARVGFIDIDTNAAQKLVADLPEGVVFENRDLRDVEALRQGIAGIRAKLGPITILVNNAARDDRHDMDGVTSEYWDERMAANLKHQFFAAQAVAPDMRAAGHGAIINMGSVSWMIGQGGMPCYTTAKSAVQGLTRSLARDLGPHNIRVNAVVPGWIMTQRQIDLWVNEETEKEIRKHQCLKRKIYPDEVAKVVLFFASDEAGACTSQNYVVDGGWA
jgi:NAD(P)-dependent dehydrogenase (short-subunit alcohol dehydrogenase family)